MRSAAVDAANRLRRERPPVEALDGLQLESGAQHREGLVGGAVVDDHHLVLGIVDLKKRVRRDDCDRRLVVHRRDDGRGDRQPRLANELVVVGTATARTGGSLEAREDEHEGVGPVHEREVRGADDDAPLDQGLDHAAVAHAAALAGGPTAAGISAASSVSAICARRSAILAASSRASGSPSSAAARRSFR